MSLLLMGFVTCLSIVAIYGMTPVYGATTTTTTTMTSTMKASYSCSVSVSYTSGTFYVKTTVTASGGYLPGPSESDYLQSYHSGKLFNTQTMSYSVSSNTASTTVTIPVMNSQTGSYSFQSTISSGKSQLATCSGAYTL